MVIHKTTKTTVMEKALKQKSLKKSCWCLVASRCDFITGFAWCFLGYHRTTGAVVYSRYTATIKQVDHLTSHYTGSSEGVNFNSAISEDASLSSVARGVMWEILGTKFFSLEGAWELSGAWLGQAGVAGGQEKWADQPVHTNILASVYLPTVGRSSIAFRNPDSLLFLWDARLLWSKP